MSEAQQGPHLLRGTAWAGVPGVTFKRLPEFLEEKTESSLWTACPLSSLLLAHVALVTGLLALPPTQMGRRHLHLSALPVPSTWDALPTCCYDQQMRRQVWLGARPALNFWFTACLHIQAFFIHCWPSHCSPKGAVSPACT